MWVSKISIHDMLTRMIKESNLSDVSHDKMSHYFVFPLILPTRSVYFNPNIVPTVIG